MLVAAASAGACGGAKSTTGTEGAGASGTGGVSHGSTGTGTDHGSGGSGGSSFITSSGTGNMDGFEVTPAGLQTLTVPIGQTTQTVKYTATLNGQPVSAAWSVDQGNIGTIPAGPSSTALFAPTGTTGGVVNILATHGGKTLKRQVMIKLTGKQSGPNPTNPQEQAQVVLRRPRASRSSAPGAASAASAARGSAPRSPTCPR